MIYKFLKNCEATNPFIEKRMIYVELDPMIRARELPRRSNEESADDLEAEGVRRGAEARAERERSEVEARARSEREKLASQLSAQPVQQNPEQVREETGQGKGDAEARIVRQARPESRENPREVLKPYINKIKDAFEALKKNPSKLYEYIMSHRQYGAGNWKRWNKDFCTTFSLPLKEVKSPKKEYQLYGGALQLYLYDEFNEGKNPVKVFDLAKKRGTNPFMYLQDGKIGAYTVSVLSAYWNRNFTKMKNPNNKEYGLVDYSNLNKEEDGEAVYNRAIAELNRRLGEDVKTAPQVNQSTSPAASPQSSSEQPPASAPASQSAPTPAPKQVTGQNESILPARLKQQAKEFAEKVFKSTQSYSVIYSYLEEAYNKQKADFKKMDNTKEPSSYNFDKREGSWPDKEYEYYKEYYDGIGDSKEAKATAPEIVRKYEELKVVVEDYNRQVGLVKQALLNRYIEKAKKIITDYDLPDFFLPDITQPNIYAIQSNKINIFTNKRPEGIKRLFQDYFKPNVDLKKSPADLITDLFNGETDDERRGLKETFIKAVAGSNGTESQAISQLKEIIRLRNMYFVYSEYNNMRNNFDRDSKKGIRILDDNYNEYKKLKSENKEKDFPSFVVKKI